MLLACEDVPHELAHDLESDLYLKSVKDLDKAESNLNQILSKLNFLNHIISLNEKYMSNKKLINYGYELIKKYENADKSQVYLNEAQVMRDKLNKIRELNLRYIQNKKSCSGLCSGRTRRPGLFHHWVAVRPAAAASSSGRGTTWSSGS